MIDTSKDTALIQVLAQRLVKQRLPRALSLKKRVDSGERLSGLDIQFLEDVFNDAQQIQPLVDRHPEWQNLAARLIQLYKEITDRALTNERVK